MRQWLVDLRAKKNMLQKDVASLCGCSRNFYTMIERGKRTPRPVLAQKIGFALGFDWTIFFANESNEMTHSKAV